MTDDTIHKERLQRSSKSAAGSSHKEPEGLVDYCAAFGYLRGLREQSASVEFRFRRGASMWFPYSWLGPWRFDPSDGLLLKFSGDLVYLVLIRGSNIDRPLDDGTINLTHAGLQRHRVLWVREMSADEVRQVGEAGPTIDSITIAAFESNTELEKWLVEHAPEFGQ
jgi:hypothetical protein